MNSLILRTTSHVLVVLLLVFSLFMLIRGHNEPGGGFIGGLLAASAFAVYALAYSAESTRRLMRADPRTLIGVGLLFAAVSGCVALFAGDAYLTAHWLSYPIPGIGKVGTVLVFDVGVYLVVLGTTLMILLTLSEE